MYAYFSRRDKIERRKVKNPIRMRKRAWKSSKGDWGRYFPPRTMLPLPDAEPSAEFMFIRRFTTGRHYRIEFSETARGEKLREWKLVLKNAPLLCNQRLPKVQPMFPMMWHTKGDLPNAYSVELCPVLLRTIVEEYGSPTPPTAATLWLMRDLTSYV